MPDRARSVARALRCAAPLAGLALAALALPEAALPAANPVTFNYSNSTNLAAYARPTGAVVVGRNFFNPALVDQIQAGGGEVYLYVNVIDGFWTSSSATGDQAALYGGAHTDPAYLMKPTRSNWPGTPLTDMRPGSPWVLHAVDHISRWFPTTHAKGLFLDVVGERLWSDAWGQMSADEKAVWAAGNRDFVHRLRVALGPRAILIANNVWTQGNPDLNGITIEHHPVSSAPSWAGMLNRTDWAIPARHIVIATSTADAHAWAKIPGVTHVTAQSSYGGPADPLLPFSMLPGVASLPATAPGGAANGGPTKRRQLAAILRGNLLTNPSFERRVLVPWSGWRGSLRRRAAHGAPHGGHIAQITFTGRAATYAVTRSAPRRVTTSAGARYSARAWVSAGSRNSIGKPVTVYLRERRPSGALVQEVRGRTVKLGLSFIPVGATLTSRHPGDRIEISVVQDRARSGNSFQLDAVSLAPVR